jgi:hypothetical protein
VPLDCLRARANPSLSDNKYRTMTRSEKRVSVLIPAFNSEATIDMTLRSVLMGAGRVVEARKQFLAAAKSSWNPASVARSSVLLLMSCVPKVSRPLWLSRERPLP